MCVEQRVEADGDGMRFVDFDPLRRLTQRNDPVDLVHFLGFRQRNPRRQRRVGVILALLHLQSTEGGGGYGVVYAARSAHSRSSSPTDANCERD